MKEPVGRHPGMLLNHVEMLYQPGERELAGEFFRALGCKVETKLHDTYAFAFVDADFTDIINNVLYLSEIRPEQAALEKALQAAIGRDENLAQGLKGYLQKRRTRPHGIPHFGIRYPSFDSIEEVIARLESLKEPLRGRVEGPLVIRPGDDLSMTDDLIQAFVATDVAFTGLGTLGQMIELQAQQIVTN